MTTSTSRRRAPTATPQATDRQITYHLFETPLGLAALAWTTTRAVCGALLPGEASASAAVQRWPGATAATPPAWVRAVARRMVDHLRGRPDPLLDVALELDGASPFDRCVWAAAREVPPGTVMTYGQLASRIGRPGAARAVGGAMGRNRIPFIVPCHRIVAASGLGGFSSAKGLKTKRAMLAAEGVTVQGSS